MPPGESLRWVPRHALQAGRFRTLSKNPAPRRFRLDGGRLAFLAKRPSRHGGHWSSLAHLSRSSGGKGWLLRIATATMTAWNRRNRKLNMARSFGFSFAAIGPRWLTKESYRRIYKMSIADWKINSVFALLTKGHVGT